MCRVECEKSEMKEGAGGEYVFVCHKSSEGKKKMEILVSESIEPSLSLTRKPNKAFYTHAPVNSRLNPRGQNRKNEGNRPCPRWNIQRTCP